MSDIHELHTEAEFREAFPVLKELRPHLDEAQYFELLGAMRERGYRMFAAREDGQIVAIVGVEIAVNFHQGRHLWVYNLIALPSVRHKGYGSRLMTFVEQFAQDEGCSNVTLWSGTFRTDAHHFYEDRMHYERLGYVFSKDMRFCEEPAAELIEQPVLEAMAV